MKSAGKALSRFGIAGVVVAAALTTAVATAGSASADQVNGGYFTNAVSCAQAGHNRVEQGFARDFTCAHSDTHNPPWHLILFT
ncbi:MAG TPA: hypothetical protein VGP26_22065 [Actinophytocola sp.]|nr:hypothetical protein [Actinophytocola sp.]